MLITLQGTVSEEIDGLVVVEVNGLGYGIFVPADEAEQLSTGTQVKFYIYEHWREDTHQLFGFQKPEDRRLFTQLLSVSGVGPKVALAILSGAGAGHIRQAIVEGNAGVLQSAPGVGTRTAERIIVELKNRLSTGMEETLAGDASQSDDAVYQALRQLGYSAAQAQAASQRVPADVTGEEARLKRALQEIGS